MKLYTRRGDDGTTDLIGGPRVSKDSLRIEACGTVDELNAAVGMIRSACEHSQIDRRLEIAQRRLFEIGADLATPQTRDETDAAKASRLDESHVRETERFIDQLSEPLAPMKHFVLPGGGELSARLHLARAVCRRAERVCVTLAGRESINPHAIVYLNRLSDLLFAAARRANQLDGVNDVPWRGGDQIDPG